MAEIITSRKKPEPRSTRGKLNRARQYKVTEGQPKDISVTLKSESSQTKVMFIDSSSFVITEFIYSGNAS